MHSLLVPPAPARPQNAVQRDNTSLASIPPPLNADPCERAAMDAAAEHAECWCVRDIANTVTSCVGEGHGCGMMGPTNRPTSHHFFERPRQGKAKIKNVNLYLYFAAEPLPKIKNF